MHLYGGPSTEFISNATQNRLAALMEASFFNHYRFHPGQAEVRSWQNSLRSMAMALQLGDFVDHGILLEWQLPLSSKRLDCMVTGVNEEQQPGAVIVELKQWDEVAQSNVEDCVTVFLAGRLRDVLHPSKQVGQYQRYLQDVHTVFSNSEVLLQACSYLHNHPFDRDGEIYSERHSDLLATNPVYSSDQLDDLTDYLSGALSGGHGLEVLDTVLRGSYRPHKRLLDHTARVIADEPSFVLLDEQLVVFNTVLAKVRARQLAPGKTAILVHGGPGTGNTTSRLRTKEHWTFSGGENQRVLHRRHTGREAQ